MAGNTPKSRAIGAELRRVRENARLSTRQLATKIGVTHTTISRWESGERSPRPSDVATFLMALDAPNDLREELVTLSGEGAAGHWLTAIVPEWRRGIATLLELEREAVRIVDMACMLMPGQLQTSGYVRSMMITGGVPADEVETRVAVRLGRRDVIMRKDHPAELLAIIDESAIRRDIGGAAIMADQLRALAEASQWVNVEVRAVPTAAGWHPGLEGPFVLLEFADRPPVVQIENRASVLYLHEPADVEPYRQAANSILEIAMTSADTQALVAATLKRMETT